MDRFIGLYGKKVLLIQLILKSNMDRFIESVSGASSKH